MVRALTTGLVGAVALSLLQLGSPSNAMAAPPIPDIDSLIDDSAPLFASADDLGGSPVLWFSTQSGLLCRERTVKISQQLTCAGPLPGQPAGTQVVTLATAYGQALGPAAFEAKTADEYFGAAAGTTPIVPVPGHKIVFWNFSATDSFMCGVPGSADLVCVLKAQQYVGASTGPPVTHGFVIGAPKSWVF
ncbi:hypothetical protein DE4585_02674 [Mycobacteroides salmoniphilum]|uniref:Uncharacterized protein n=1 Tax=Mycobacteroides salmoniphilum TaxID=404941 RepID=A0A4V3HY86_9MYCO|nr:hypothetical protein DE4585_02674 [Mycobacteroides salmoniphilum]